VADVKALSRQASLQQVERGVELPARENLALNVRERRTVQSVDALHQALETRQTCGISDTSTTKKHHPAFLVRLHKRIWNIRAICFELHLLPLLPSIRLDDVIHPMHERPSLCREHAKISQPVAVAASHR
jgi:hypothetical protein